MKLSEFLKVYNGAFRLGTPTRRVASWVKGNLDNSILEEIEEREYLTHRVITTYVSGSILTIVVED